MDSEGALIRELVDGLSNFIDQDKITDVKNLIISSCYKYDIREKQTELVPYDNYNEKMLKQFLATKRIEGRSEKTLERYAYFIRKLMDFYPNLTFRDMSTSSLRYFMAVYQQQGNDSSTSMDGIRRIFSSFFNWLSDEDMIDKSPAKRLSKIKHDSYQEEPFTEWEMEAIMVYATDIKDKAIFEFLYSTACRVSELCQVKVSDINAVKKTVLLHGKGNKDRVVPLTDKAMFYINEYMKDRESKGIESDFLFVSTHFPYAKLKPDAIRKKLLLISKRARVNHAHPHRYRVTRITTLLKRGMKLEEVQVIAGHTDISTTALYNRSDMTLVESEFRRRG